MIDQKQIVVLIPGARGITLLSTVALRGIRKKFPNHIITALCWFPELLEGLDYIDKVIYPVGPFVFEEHILDHRIIDLTDNVNYLPNRQRRKMHIIDILCAIAKVQNDGMGPDIFIPSDAYSQAEDFLHKESINNKNLYVFHPKSSSINKDWIEQEWKNLVDLLIPFGACLQVGGDNKINDMIISVPIEGKMQYALLKKAKFIFCVDSLFLHATSACSVKNCVVLLGSSDPKVVSYKNYINFYKKVVDCQPCGRPYINFDLMFDSDGKPIKDTEGNYLKWRCPHRLCFTAYKATDVFQILRPKLFI